MIPTFVIFLREGIEASMIVALLLAYLRKTNHRDHFRDVYVGVVAAFVLIFAGGAAAYFWISQYQGSKVQTYFETSTYLIAALFLTYMTFWMQSHARTIGKDLQNKSDAILSSGKRWGIRVLAFQSVGREGLETMVFTLAIIFASSRQAGTPIHGNLLWLGAIAGLTVSLAVAYLMYKVGAKLNIRRFFRVLGVVLMIFAAGLLVDTVQNLQTLGWLTIGTQVLWDSHGVVLESSNLGNVLHSFVGYADHPTLAQLVVGCLYVAGGIGWFIRSGRMRAPKPTVTA